MQELFSIFHWTETAAHRYEILMRQEMANIDGAESITLTMRKMAQVV